VSIDSRRIFASTVRAFLTLFDRGEANVPRAESLAVRRILYAAARPEARSTFIDI
jgi:hypothetical protein